MNDKDFYDDDYTPRHDETIHEEKIDDIEPINTEFNTEKLPRQDEFFSKLKKNKKERSEMVGKRRKPKNKKKIGKIILLVILLGFILSVVAGIIFFAFIAISAPKFDPEKLYTKEASILYDSDGKEFAKLGNEMRQRIKYSQVSETLVNAIIATEDSRFFEHNGFDLPRFSKATFGQAMHQDAGGASTLTMQIAKNQFNGTESEGVSGIIRKFSDIYMAIFQIERNYSKEQILEFYMNAYYLGSGSYGVEQAANTYFNKNAKDLNLSESAMIAGLYQSPVALDPNKNPEKTEERRLIVLKLMKRHGYVTDEEYNIAKQMTVEDIVVMGQSSVTEYAEYQAFVDTVAIEVKERTGYDPYSYSMKIYTTMDRKKQDEITKIMSGQSFKWENDKVDAGVVVMETKTGAIVAIGAGRNRTGAKSFNNATMTKRQIGSTAKPLFDYGPAVEYLDWNTYHPIIDGKYSYSDGTEINNWDGRYRGIITIRQALVESRNIPALKTFQSVKNSDVKSFVTKLGLSPESYDNGKLHEAHAIGGYNGESPLTVAAAYAAFGNNGYYNDPHSFTKVIFDQSKKTYTVEAERTKVMGKDTAYMVTDMLVDTGQNALGDYKNINESQFAAKTGTTNFDKKTLSQWKLPSNAVNDLWVAGYNADYSIAVWYGYDRISSSSYNRFGSSQNSRLFQAVAKNFFKSSATFTKPDNVVEVTVERNCGYPLLPSANTPSNMKVTELFKEKSKPTEISNRFNTLPNVSNVSATVDGIKATISWKAIGTPDSLNRGYWEPIVGRAFAIASDKNSYLNYVMNYNVNYLGSVIYNVYLKIDGELTKVASLSGTSTTITLPIASSPTYVVKASYSGFGGSESSGVAFMVDYGGANIGDMSVSLNGSPTVNMSISPYIDFDPPVTVKWKGEDITSDPYVKIVTTITDSGGSTVNSVGSVAGTFTITYKVTFDKKEIDTITRKVIVT